MGDRALRGIKEETMGVASSWGPAFRFGVPGVVAGLVLAWGLGAGRVSTLRAQPTVPGADGSGTIAFTTAASPGAPPMLYLIDTRSRAFAIYRIAPQKGTVKWGAARQYRYDLQLSEYNNSPPEAAAVEAMVSTTTAPKR